MMQTLNIDLGARSYPILIGAGLLEQTDWAARCAHREVAIISNHTIAQWHLAPVIKAFAGRRCIQVLLDDGEQYKNWQSLQTIFDALIEHQFSRGCLIVALGGGVVGDIAGYAAASYQRGIDFIQIPTTLLAQVDSSVGGKTGINHPQGKNMIGAFHQPRLVVADVQALRTLPARELSAGLAEVVKYGAIMDIDFFSWLEENADALIQRDESCLSYIIERSCACKAEIVAADEHERGRRALLNFGHTYGHAIESATQYRRYLHGEAVSIGMMLAAELSQQLGKLAQADVARLRTLLQRLNLPTEPESSLSARQLLDLMARDKKVIDTKVRLILLSALGDAQVCDDYDSHALDAQINAIFTN